MFRGLHSINLDAKGRMAVPTKYRQPLEDRCASHLVATIDTEENCLLVYPLPEWELIQEKIESLPSYDPKVRRIQRLLIGHATDLELDASGRVLLSQPLREYAKLDKEIVLVGQGKKLEIWSKLLWESRCDEYLDEAQQSDQLPPDLMNLSI